MVDNIVLAYVGSFRWLQNQLTISIIKIRVAPYRIVLQILVTDEPENSNSSAGRPRVRYAGSNWVVSSASLHGILDGPLQEQSKHPQEPKLPPNLRRRVSRQHYYIVLSCSGLAFPCLPLPVQDPATPGSPCSKPRYWLVIDWTLINHKSIVTGSPLLLLRLKKKRGTATSLTVPSALPSAHPPPPASKCVLLLRERVKRRQPICVSPDFPSRTRHLRNSPQIIDIFTPNDCRFSNSNYYLFYLSRGIGLQLGWTARLHYDPH
jgi:hypothetical protein